MAKKFLQDMIKRDPAPQAKPSIVKILPLQRKEISSPEPIEIPAPKATQKVETPNVVIPEPKIKAPEPVVKTNPVKYEPVNYSNFETRFSSVNDMGDDDRKSKPHYKLWIVAVCSALFLVFTLSYLFANAKITINPKSKDVTVNSNISAVKDASANDFPFDLVVISGEVNKTVPAGAEKDVIVPATGKVLIYNAYSSAPQNLDIDTRLEGSNGKLYKTKTKTTVPGMKGSTPGSVEVSIYAAVPGAEGNSSPIDFKIFGFKGSPKYTKFYARSKGDITGGFAGKSSDISDTDKAKLVVDLKNALKDKLSKQAQSQIPNGFILYPEAVVLNTNGDAISTEAAASGTATATMKGTLSGFLFDESKLTQKIAQGVLLPTEDVTQVFIPNIRDLTFSLTGRDALPSDITNVNFNLSGKAKIVYKIDSAKLTTDILGKSKKDFNAVLAQYPTIDSAQLVMRPFWNRALPKTEKDIKVIVNYPTNPTK
ncbi:hypothetical protein K2P96_01205 [Patescibacteria group bacterium]|nr:hypothetical protein [Patescibacteria group bacterium]